MNVARFCGLVLVCAITVPISAVSKAGSGDAVQKAASARLAIGKELFTREWQHNDKRSLAGDGLGPVFNERSCAKCHEQGGVGGAGRSENNVTIVSVFVDLSMPRMLRGIPPKLPDPNKPVQQPEREQLAEIHPTLRSDNSFALQRFASDKRFDDWKAKYNLKSESVQLMSGRQIRINGVKIALIHSQRNTPALFGAGLIDRIPRSALEKVAVEQAALQAASDILGWQGHHINPRERRRPFQSLPITGRVANLKDNKTGKFGWKASVASLHEFTLQACANEIGLEVPGFARAAPPWVKDYKAPGLDLSADQCQRLTEFIASLPRPTEASASNEVKPDIAAGQKLFGKLGCATCHRPKMGDVDGIYDTSRSTRQPRTMNLDKLRCFRVVSRREAACSRGQHFRWHWQAKNLLI